MLHPLSARCRPDSNCDRQFRQRVASSTPALSALAAAVAFLFAPALAGATESDLAGSTMIADQRSPAGPGADLADDLAAATLPPGSVAGTEATTPAAGALALPSGVGVASSALSATPAPAVIYLQYADGSTLPGVYPNPCSGPAPKFVCQFAPTLAACEQQIQAYLDRWYADFNVVFTLTRPTSGPYYTEVVSSGGGAWCGAKENVGGIAPFLCKDLAGGVSYTFAGGRTAKETAVIIAQEQAHLVGLEHSASPHDVMYPTICTDCDGFEDTNNQVQGDVCERPQQNAYQLMLARLGRWTGGVKPTPFGCVADMSAPSVTILEPSDKAIVDSTFTLRVQASDDCRIDRATVQVSPMGLQATSTHSPFEWTLTRIKGQQKITVSVTDPSNKTSTASITVNAPGSGSATPSGTGGANGAGTGGGGGGQSGAAGAGGGVTTDGGALNAQRNTTDQAAAGCEVGGCDLTDSRSRSSSSVSFVITGVWMALVLRRRSAASSRRAPRTRA